MSDHETTLADLKAAVAEFVDARDWRQFHNPKNLAMAIAIEAAELMEHFQWLTPEQAAALRESPERKQQLRDELADVLCFALSFANATGIDVADAVREKILKNARKYPADRFQGRFR